jgi:hypothetical protein
MSYFGILRRYFVSGMLALSLLCYLPDSAFADASSASLSIIISDTSGAVIPDATAILRNSDTNQQQTSASSKSGNASFPFLKPGHYSLTVSKDGFSDVTVNGILLNVGDDKHLQLILKVGSASQNITVDGSGITINTTDGSVSTVIDRQFVANIPLNGRSFQDLISMTPGVVTATPQNINSSPGSNGDFSINGQRTESNYYMVDGVAANVSAGPGASSGYGPAGTMAATSALGTTQSLLSVDALQEFRVESSSYSAEYGRSPGGQLSFITRSGTNDYHGSAYDYLRNGWFDANDWFNDELRQPKQELHQNDFGGTFGGPLWIPGSYKGTNKTFFFASYEGLRLSQPIAASIQYVPDVYMREQAPPAIQPLLNAFPQQSPNGIDYGTQQAPSLAQFFQGYTVPGSINSTSVRVDQTFTPALSAFFRFADTPSSADSRSYSLLSSAHLNTQTYTLGTTYLLSNHITDQFRLGYTRSYSGSSTIMDSFGGATPIDLGQSMGNTTGTTGETVEAQLELDITGAGQAELTIPASIAKQHQWNVTDTADITHGAQQMKFGVDFRRIVTEQIDDPIYIGAYYYSAQSVLSNSADDAEYEKQITAVPVYNQFALFAQDEWRLNSRLSLSAGLRWELAPPPHNATSPQPYTVTGNLGIPSTLNLAPAGTPMWHTSWYNFAPRLGLAWQAHQSKDWGTVFRVGGGVFFDTSNQAAVPAFGDAFGFSAFNILIDTPMPLTQAQQGITITTAPPYTNLDVYPPHLQLPYTNEWNASIEQGFGNAQSLTLSYIGSAGRRLTGGQELKLAKLNALFGTVFYSPGNLTSDYDALQAKFQRSVSKGVTALVSYTWSHSLDYGSNFAALPLTRGNSDFDVRNNFQGGINWELPHVTTSGFAATALNGWGVDGRLLARTSFPITLEGNRVTDPTSGSEYYTNVDLVRGQATYLYGDQYPGGHALNPAAFAFPTGSDPGNAPRNFTRGFGESQVNFSVRREFALTEKTHLQFRAEAFNVFNHPNFGYVDPYLTDPTFGQATKMLNQSLGTVASQYQQGGPRSMQFALRLAF